MEIKIYLTNLAKYNEGYLVGEWVELPMDEDELQDKLAEILGDDEEYFITDYEAPFRIEEYSNLTELNRIAEELEDLDEDLVTAFCNQTGEDIEEIIEIISRGNYSSYHDVDGLDDVARQMVDDGLYGEIPESLEMYIDFDAIGRDLDCNGWYYDDDTRIAYCRY